MDGTKESNTYVNLAFIKWWVMLDLFQPKKQAQEGHIMDIWYMIYDIHDIHLYVCKYIIEQCNTYYQKKNWDFGSSFGNHLSVDPIHPLNSWSPEKKKRTCAATKATPFEAWSVQHWFRRWTELRGEKSVESQGLREECLPKLNQTLKLHSKKTTVGCGCPLGPHRI